MPSLKDFIDALSVAWPVALTALIGSTAILAANAYGVVYATGIPGWMLTVLFVVAVFAAGSCFTALVQLVAKAPAWLLKWYRTGVRRKAEIAWLNNLPAHEHRLMAYLFSTNTQAFPYPFGEDRFVGLIQKGLVLRPGGAYQAMSWPHVVPDHIWAEMKKNPAKFRHPQNAGNPMMLPF
ncbi:hypothetical protein EN875_032170 [Mesorhizobium sp. M2D.F.Ca.ET.232.01.1.1]|uniref:hypothetical protein n=1 Tax=Mesorhizobium sp. M2D.F.Ca.ET.232.01.1.1 TaxID=2496670 RepID=UPI000FCC71C8|nr:hypothetical protein [Mesorhizobium sp. M2D.F.Ca.ET.232.01.1.1]TGP28215.1 hypothetical protein EN875_032170 [Mesorhizobium sp. M2D.F.Ca.ET.232.01.1.1]